jgi:hypothetical protein
MTFSVKWSSNAFEHMKLMRWQHIHHVEKDGTYCDSHSRTDDHESLTRADAYELVGLSWLVQYRQRGLYPLMCQELVKCVFVYVSSGNGTGRLEYVLDKPTFDTCLIFKLTFDTCLIFKPTRTLKLVNTCLGCYHAVVPCRRQNHTLVNSSHILYLLYTHI